MTPAEFLDWVVVPNVAAVSSDIGDDVRLAVKAILSLDALTGVLHADRHTRGLETANDIEFRDRQAKQHPLADLLRLTQKKDAERLRSFWLS